MAEVKTNHIVAVKQCSMTSQCSTSRAECSKTASGMPFKAEAHLSKAEEEDNLSPSQKDGNSKSKPICILTSESSPIDQVRLDNWNG